MNPGGAPFDPMSEIPSQPGNPINPPRDLPDDPTISYKPPDGDATADGVPMAPWYLGAMGEARTFEGSEASPTPSPSDTADPIPADLSRIAPPVEQGFNLLRIIGEGGSGEVWEAEQRSLRRVIAVKKIREERLQNVRGNPRAAGFLIRQFEQEALTAAHLDHPNILPTYDLAKDREGLPLLAMKRVRGTPWLELLARDLDSMPYEDYLARHIPILLDVAQAVAFAHSRGVVHRDIKPSQVMVGEYGEVLLMDWGLAILYDPSALENLENSTIRFITPTVITASSPAGTPVYMAPEQTEGTAAHVGPWTDVYLLGGTLYYLLSGQPPHRQGDKEQTFAHAARGEVVPLEDAAAGRELPQELRDLALHALRPARHERVPSARIFLERLQAYLTGASRRQESARLVQAAREMHAAHHRDYRDFAEAIGILSNARTLWPKNPEVEPLRVAILLEYGRVAIANGDLVMARTRARQIPEGDEKKALLASIEEKEQELARREYQRRVGLMAASLLFLVTIAVAVVAINQARLASRAGAEARDALDEARHQREEAVKQGERAEREQYFAAIGYASSTLRDFNILRIRQLLDACSPPLRQWEWHYLDSAISRHAQLLQTDHQLLALRVSPDGRLVAFGGETPLGFLWDREQGGIRPLEGHSDKIYSLDFSPDGRFLVTASKDTSLRLWEVATGRPVRVYGGHTSFVNSVDFHPDGSRFASASSDGTIRIWDVETGGSTILRGHSGLVMSVMYDRSGGSLLSASSDRVLRIWDLATGTARRVIQTNHSEAVTSACWSPDESRILTTSWDTTARLYEGETGREVAVLDAHDQGLYRAGFSPDGRLAVVPSLDGTISVWSAPDGRFLFRVIGHEGGVWGVDFLPGTSEMLTASYDRTIRRWDLAALDPGARPIHQPAAPVAAGVRIFHSDDVSLQGLDNSWISGDGRNFARVGPWDVRVDHGTLVTSADDRWRVRLHGASEVLDAAGGRVADLGIGALRAAGFSPDGRFLLAGGETEAVLFETTGWTRVAAIPETPSTHIVAFSADSRRMAVNSLNHITQVWDLQDARPLSRLEGGEPMGAFAIALSPDGSEVAVALSPSYTIDLYDPETGVRRNSLIGHTYRIWSLDYSPDGRRLASASWDDTVRIWEPVTGREVLLMPRLHKGAVLGVAWGAGGRLLVAPTAYGEIELWDGGGP